MNGAREGFIRSVLTLLGSESIFVWINNLADPDHPDFCDTLPPHLWGTMPHRCVRCGIRGGPNHVLGSFYCNLLRAAEAYYGSYFNLNML